MPFKRYFFIDKLRLLGLDIAFHCAKYEAGAKQQPDCDLSDSLYFSRYIWFKAKLL